MFKNYSKICLILFIDELSTFFAEFTVGSYPLWFEPSGLLMTYPLYTLHILLLLNIAIRTKKTAIYRLYLFGMVFALYEFSYIGIIIFILMAAIYLLTNQEYDFMSLTLVVFGNFLVISVLYIILKKIFKNKIQLFSIYSLELGKTGFLTTIILLIILYVITFLIFNPEKIPNTLNPYLSILFSYVLIIFLINKSKTFINSTSNIDTKVNILNFKYTIIIPILIIIVGIIFTAFPFITTTLSIVIYLMMIITGIVLCILCLKTFFS